MQRGRYCLVPGMAALAIAATSLAPGNACVAQTAAARQLSGTSVTYANAVVFGIDAGRNSIRLLADNGESVDVVIDRRLGDVGKLRLGDTINVTFSRALLLRADKSSSPGIRERIDKGFTTGQTLGSSLSMHRVEAVATVVRIERDKHQLTLREPTQTVTLQASSDRLLDGLSIGDSIRVDYVEATAIEIKRDGVPLR
jgi:hypothetical protein